MDLFDYSGRSRRLLALCIWWIYQSLGAQEGSRYDKSVGLYEVEGSKDETTTNSQPNEKISCVQQYQNNPGLVSILRKEASLFYLVWSIFTPLGRRLRILLKKKIPRLTLKNSKQTTNYFLRGRGRGDSHPPPSSGWGNS